MSPDFIDLIMRLILTQCFPPLRGGIETLMLGLVRALSDVGEQVLVYADGGAAARRYDLQHQSQLMIRRFGGWKPWRRRYKAICAARHQPVAVYCDSWKSMEMFAGNGAVFAHGSEFPQSPSLQKKRRIGKALAKATTIYAVSRAAAMRAIICGAVEDKIKITPPPLLVPSSPTKTEQLQAQQLWGNATPKILTVARLTARKGIDRTIMAAAMLAARYPDLKYMVVGGGEQEKELRALAATAGVNVCFAGAADDGLKSALYAAADIFVLPARIEKDDMEGFGIVYLEAAWFGLPSIGGNCGGAKEAVQDGKTGLLCDGDSAQSVCDSMATLLGDAAMQKQMRAQATAHAKTQTWEHRIGDFL